MITSPADGSSFDEGVSINFAGTASDEGADISSSIEWSSDVDGSLGTGSSFFTSTLSVDTHVITASVTDGVSAVDDQITVTVISTGNVPPTVSITSPGDGSSFADGTSINFTGTASDEGADINSSIEWSSNLVGSLGTGASIFYTLPVGTHEVTASVTDGGGASADDKITVTVDPPPGAITLSAAGSKTRGLWTVDLSWSGATSGDVDVYRDGSLIDTTANGGSYTDSKRGGESLTYRVCEAGDPSTCSNTVTVTP
jgi:hypothetical protein